jgi:pyruvate dehydrogenase E2 component (dihydrolipoamide acetyltransferase)
MADFLMPSLGADMETGKVVQWLIQPGSRVKRGDVVAVVETHKGAIDVEIFLDGVIDNLVPIGEELKVGAVLAHVQEPGEPAPSTAPATTARARVSPAARRRAHELGVDPDRLHGTGTDGSVTLADVEKAGSEAAPAPAVAATPAPPAPSVPAPAAPAAPERPRGGFDTTLMRQAIARAMSRSKREIPHYYLTTTIDFAAASSWLESYNRDRAPDARLLPAALLLKASARALGEVPQLNGFYENDAFRAGPGIHIGWAIALRGGGLVAPAIHDADRKALPELMTALRDLVQRARTGGLRSSELTDPTVTVTSLGDRGAECVLGVIYPPQVAIIGFGRLVDRPWVVQGQIQPRPLVEVSLAADHRASDGHVGGLLLAAIDRALQQPETL